MAKTVVRENESLDDALRRFKRQVCGEEFFVLRLIPRLQRLHALVRPGEGLLLHVLCQLVAEVGVGRGLERVAVVTLDLLIAVAEVEVFFAVGHRAGVDEGAVEPALVHDRKVWMHPSFLLIRGDRASCRRARIRDR